MLIILFVMIRICEHIQKKLKSITYLTIYP